MKKIFNYVLAISAIVIGMAFGSCNEEEFPSPSHPDGDVVPVILSVEVADLVSSRAIDENLISDHYCPVKAGKSVFEIVET